MPCPSLNRAVAGCDTSFDASDLRRVDGAAQQVRSGINNGDLACCRPPRGWKPNTATLQRRLPDPVDFQFDPLATASQLHAQFPIEGDTAPTGPAKLPRNAVRERRQ